VRAGGGTGSGCVAGAHPGKATTTTDLSKKPVVEVPDGPLPCELAVTDIVEGTGPAAKPGDQLTMRYVGVTWSTGEEFDASWDSGSDFPVTLGAGMVIQGWDQGLVGMKQGGRRQLVIPPSLAYGDQAQNGIPANSTLIFVVDLVKIG
jgi:peptidylprolyl isomerase